jgi:DNA-binding Lrp family transcriptional regulator
MPPKKEDEFFEYLKKEKQVNTAYRCYGVWDAVFAALAKDPLELHDILSRIEEKFGENIGNWTIETHVGSHYFGRNYLSEDFEPKAFTPITGGKVEKAEIEDKDKRILSVLRENARASTIELAEDSKLTPDIVRYRTKKLREAKILLGATLLPDYTNYPYMFYRILLNIGRLNPEKEKALTNFFASKPNAFRLNRTFGKYEMSVDVEVKNEEEFRSILSDLKSKFYDILLNFDYLHIWKVERSCYFVSV